MLTHLMKDAKRHQRSITITLLDLRNAFGEINHKLIESIDYHHIPPVIRKLISATYTDYLVNIAVGSKVSSAIVVGRGVLQGDPGSPLIFNLCFNPLMRLLANKEYQQFGYMWGPSAELKSRGWLQFADDTAIISHNMEGAQRLIDLNIAWCKWAGMSIRIDKCSTFGMRKQNGRFEQYKPKLSIDNETIPQIEIGDHFVYLGKIFDFALNNVIAKENIKNKLRDLLKTTDNLKICSQQKLKILRIFVPSHMKYDLRSYDISLTWIAENLDTMIVNAVREWLSLPINTCVSEVMSLPFSKGGYNIKSLRFSAEKMRINLRNYLKNNKNDEVRTLKNESSTKFIQEDIRLDQFGSAKLATKSLRDCQETRDIEHIFSLRCQGVLFKSIIENISQKQIGRWARDLEKLPEVLYKFARKALQQQLPTNSNLQLWGKTNNPICPLCNFKQTNKHVLANCGSIAALSRFTDRHNKILTIILEWLQAHVLPGSAIYADLSGTNVKPISDIFNSLRPDIAIIRADLIETLELTVCHETNFQKSKLYKLEQNVDSRGLFDEIRAKLTLAAISSSYLIYCNRNNANV